MKVAGTEAVSHTYGDRNGQLLKSTYANGWEVSYTYDSMDRVTQVKAAKGSSSYVIGQYLYDRQGRVARFVDGQVPGKSCTYGYDLTDRLCEAVFDDGTAYTYTYDANDCLVKEHHTLPGGNRDVIRAYDKDSRETSVTCGSAKVEKAFDELGRLSSIKRNGGKHVTEFTYAAASDGGATGRVKGADYYYIRDGLMCITGLIDANGGAVVNYRYDSWGKLISITGSMADTLGKDNPYRYKGYYYDDETGMYYLKSRYYQPEICRFIIARAMGQEFGVKDVAVAAVLGAVGGICGGYRDWRKYIGAAANGIYVGTVAYRSGANLGASLVSGGIAALFSASGIGDLASLPLVDEGR